MSNDNQTKYKAAQFRIGHRKEAIRQEKKEEVDQSGNVKVAHSGVKSESNRYLKVSEIISKVFGKTGNRQMRLGALRQTG